MNPIEVDARGLRCPLPVIRLAAAARDAPAGTRIIVLASDPAARHDIPAWCRMRGHELREMTEMPEVTEMTEITEVTDPAYLRFVVLSRDPASAVEGCRNRQRKRTLEPGNVVAARDLRDPQARQMWGGPLDVDDPAWVAIGEHQIRQAHQRALGRVGRAMEHRLPGEEPTEGQSVQATEQLTVTPRLDRVGPSQLVQTQCMPR